MAAEVAWGSHPEEVAERFGVTKQAVRSAAKNRGIPTSSARRHGNASERCDEMARRVAAGDKPEAIAADMGADAASVRNAARRRGIRTARSLAMFPAETKPHQEADTHD